MSEPVLNVSEGNRAQGLGYGIHQGFQGASLGRAQSCLDFRPTQFNRVEVGGIGWQEFQTCALRFNQLTNAFAGMGRQVIQQEDVARAQGREQLRVNIGFKGDAIDGTFKNPRGSNFLPPQGGNEGVMRTRIAGRGFHDPLPGCGATTQARQAQMSATFIEKFQAFHQFTQTVHELMLEVPPQGFYPRRLALAVVERLFFRGKFKICNSRHIMLSLASKPLASWTRSHNSANVTSGCFLISARRNPSAASSFRLGPGVPAKAAQLPVSRQRYHHFSNVDLLMLNCAATSAWVFPASRTAITRSRKSWE